MKTHSEIGPPVSFKIFLMMTSGKMVNRPYAHDVILVRRPRLEVKRGLLIGQSMCVSIVSSPFDLKDGGWMTSMHKVYSSLFKFTLPFANETLFLIIAHPPPAP